MTCTYPQLRTHTLPYFLTQLYHLPNNTPSFRFTTYLIVTCSKSAPLHQIHAMQGSLQISIYKALYRASLYASTQSISHPKAGKHLREPLRVNGVAKPRPRKLCTYLKE